MRTAWLIACFYPAAVPCLRKAGYGCEQGARCDNLPSRFLNFATLIQKAPFPVVNIIAEEIARPPASSEKAKSKKLQAPTASSTWVLEKELAEVKELALNFDNV